MTKPRSFARRVKVEPGIYRWPNGTFEIGFRDAQQKQRWRKVDGKLRAARAALAEEHARRARGERVATDPRMRFGVGADAWWEARALKLREATQNAYGASLIHVRREFGHRRMVDITADDLARYITKKQADGLKGWTIKGHLTVFSSIYKYAARHMGLVAQNPATLLDRVERPSTEDEKPKRILTADDLRRLLDAVDAAYAELFYVAAETGGRLAEVLGLAWEDVDLEAHTITFTHQLSRKRKGGVAKRVRLKTRTSRRVLEVTPDLISRLCAYKLRSTSPRPHELVFVTSAGTGHDHRNIGGRVLGRAVKAAGLEKVVDANDVVVTPAPTFHALRHSHASALIAQGWDIEEVRARLGHSSVATTQTIYVHQFDAAARSDGRRDRLARLYGADVEASVEAIDGRDTSQGAATEAA